MPLLVRRVFLLCTNRIALIAFLLALSGAIHVGCAQTTLYSEDFESYGDNYGWGDNGDNSGGFDGTETNWSLSGDDNGDYWYVNSIGGDKMFEGKDLDGESIWTSLSIDVSGYTSLSLSIELSQYNYSKMENSDYIQVFAIPDGGSEVQLFEQTNDLSGVTTETLSITATSTLQIRVKAYCNRNDERWRFDDLVLTGVSSCTDVTVTADAPTVSLDGAGAASVSAGESGAEVTVSATGDCFTVSGYEISKTNATSGFASSVSFDCTETGVQNVWVRATDGTDVSTATATTVNIQDVTDPVAVAQNLTVDLDANGAATITASDINNGSSDNCSVASLSLDITSFDCNDVGSPVTVTLTATDPSGNTDTATATVTVQDVTGPTIATPSGTYSLDGSGEALLWFGTAIDFGNGYSDACSADGDITKQISKTGDDWGTATNSVTFDCTETGSQTIYLRGTDEAGNATTVSGTITIADDTAPTITAVSPTSVQLSTGAATVATSALTFTTTENCAGEGITYTVSETSGGTFGASVDLDCSDIGTVTLYFTARDASDNPSAEFSQVFTVTDATGLSAVGQDITVALDENGGYALSASEVDNGSVGNCNTSLSVSPASFDCSDIGINEVTLTISDGGASDVTTVNVTVVDNRAPVMNTVSNPEFSLGGAGTATIDPAQIAFPSGNQGDNCTANESLTYEIKRDGDASFGSNVSLDCTDLGASSLQVIVRVGDGATPTNWFTSEAIWVDVIDEVVPTISSVSAVGETLDSNGDATIDAQSRIQGAADNCTDSGSLTYQIRKTGSGETWATTYAATCADIGTVSFDFKVIDESTNPSAITTASITISDGSAPTAVANDRTLPLNGASTVTLQADDASFNTSTDNCSLTSEIKLTSAGDGTYASSYEFPGAGSYDVTLRVTDAGGTTATDNATITVIAEPDDIVIYFEDFESEIDGSSPDTQLDEGSGEESASGRWTFDDLGTGTPYIYSVGASGNAAFNIYNGDQIFWYSSEIDISAFNYVEVSSVLYEVGTGVTSGEGLRMSAIVDGVESVVASDTDGDLSGTLTSSTVTGDVLIVKFESVGSGDMFFDDVTVTGYCVDLDGNDICDSEQDCVETAGKDCGCMDKTACTYEADATHASADSCFFPGMPFQGAACGSAGQFNFYGSDCNCASSDWTSVYSENFDDETAQDGYYFGTFTDVSGVDDPSTDGWEINLETSPNNPYQVAVDGMFSGLDAVDGNVFVFEGLQSEATWTSPEYSLTNQVYSKVSVDVGYTYWNDYDASGGFDIDDEMRGFVILDDMLQPGFVSIKGGGNAGLLGSINGTSSPMISADPSDKSLSRVETTLFVSGESSIALQMKANHDRELGGSGEGVADEFTYFDLVSIQTVGEAGCMSPGAGGYSASATYDDGSCTWSNVTAYSRYDGGFEEKIWEATACQGENGVCGTAPFPNARQVGANDETDQTTISYVISNGTTVTVNGTANVDGDPTTKDLFVKDLTIKSGGALVIPANKRLRVMGTYTDEGGSGVSGEGSLCIDGGFEIPSDGPAVVTVQDFELPPGSSVVVTEGKTLAIKGDLSFGDTDPASVSGLIALSGTSSQTISGDGATVDRLQISNTAGVTVNDSLEIQGRLTLDDSTTLAMGNNWLTFASRAVPGQVGADKTGLLDPIPSDAALTGGTGRAMQNSNAAAKVQVERYIAADDDGTTYFGFSLYGCPIDGATVSDLNGSSDFYTSGWPGSTYPNSTSTVQFWNEVSGSIEMPSSENESLSSRGCWVMSYGSQNPTLMTGGALNDHQLGGTAKTFTVTRQGPSAEFEGWNLVFNPFQAKLDWNAVISLSGQSSVIEDQFAVYDTQKKRFRRYGQSTSGVSWSNETEAGEDSIAMRYINPGQAFWVRVKDGVSSGTISLDASMIDNDASAVGFIRDVQEGTSEVLLEVENVYGANRVLLTFGESGSIEEYREGDMSFIRSSSIRSGEAAVVVGEQKYVAKQLPMEAFDGELYVESKADRVTTLRVVETLGEMPICVHIVDQVTGEIMVLEEGQEMEFTLPNDAAEEGRFTMHSVPFGRVEGLSPDCPDSEEGMIVMELGEAVADLTVTDYSSMEVVSTLYQQTGTVEMPIEPGEYAIMVVADEETSLCRGGRRQVLVAPGEQPELLGVEPMPVACNEGMASLAFELYGTGSFETALMQGNEELWSETLLPGEHTLTEIIPGDYVLKVNHICLQDFEWVSLWDEDVPSLEINAPHFVEVELDGGAWIEAECLGCTHGEGYGYHWMLNGELVGENEPLGVRVDSAGVYMIEGYTYGMTCDQEFEAEITVGKSQGFDAEGIEWLGVHAGQMGIRFPEVWSRLKFRWFDATGRLIQEGSLSEAIGEVFIDTPNAQGWLTLEVRSSSEKVIRWSGIF